MAGKFDKVPILKENYNNWRKSLTALFVAMAVIPISSGASAEMRHPSAGVCTVYGDINDDGHIDQVVGRPIGVPP